MYRSLASHVEGLESFGTGCSADIRFISREKLNVSERNFRLFTRKADSLATREVNTGMLSSTISRRTVLSANTWDHKIATVL
jgi:hypothetical protein